MIRRCTQLLLTFIAYSFSANAQYCGFDSKNQTLKFNNPAYAQEVAQMKMKLAGMAIGRNNALIVNTPTGIAYQIPVVVHVIHTGGAVGSVYNPPDAQLYGMVDYLNKVYAANWPGYPGPGAGGVKIPLQFVLAARDPNCNATNGINRVDGSGVAGYVADGLLHNGATGADEATIKALSRWPRTEYYNVWVVNKIDGEDGVSPTSSYVAGYAYLPPAPATLDGTIMLATQAIAGEVTLPHEVGHAFAVDHTFAGDMGGTACPPNANCNIDGDGICDTDPHIRSNFNCPTGTNPCTGNPYGTVVHNIMDYSNCTDRFTAGQSARMIDALLTYRSSLISSQGSVPPVIITPACIPTTSASGFANAGPRDITVMQGSQVLMDVTSSGYSGDNNMVLLDRSCKHQVNLTAGQSYDLAVKTGFAPEKVRVYIDYNNDGTFQVSELVYSHDGTLNNEVHSYNYTVPTTATQPNLISCVPLRMRVVSDLASVSTVSACGPFTSGQAEDYAVIITGAGPTVGSGNVTAAIIAGGNPSCFGSPVTFQATPGAGITNPTYEWFVNSTSTGMTGQTFTSSTFLNGDAVTVKMYFSGACGNDTSISFPIVVQRATSVPPTVSIAVTGGSNPGCAGVPVTFTATPTNGGTMPAYQWKVNGVNSGTNSNIFTSVFNNNDKVWVILTSNSSCAVPATAISPKDTIQHGTFTATVSIAQTGNTAPVCFGNPLTFKATPSATSLTQLFQWFKNGVPVPGATADSFITTTGINGDQVFAVFYPNSACFSNPNDTSNILTISAPPLDTPIVNISITQGSNPGCLDSLIVFNATVSGFGAAPYLIWSVNGLPVSAGAAFGSNTLLNGDVVTFVAAATDGACYTQDTVNAVPITMSLHTTPTPPLISFIGNMLVANASQNIVWIDPNGQIVGTGQQYHPTEPGLYYAVRDNQGCFSPPSNLLTISLLDIKSYNMNDLSIYPNPTSGRLTLDWGSLQSNIRLSVYAASGQGLLHDVVNNVSKKELNLSHFASGVYFLVLKDDHGNTGTARFTISK